MISDQTIVASHADAGGKAAGAAGQAPLEKVKGKGTPMEPVLSSNAPFKPGAASPAPSLNPQNRPSLCYINQKQSLGQRSPCSAAMAPSDQMLPSPLGGWPQIGYLLLPRSDCGRNYFCCSRCFWISCSPCCVPYCFKTLHNDMG